MSQNSNESTIDGVMLLVILYIYIQNFTITITLNEGVLCILQNYAEQNMKQGELI